MFMRIRNFLIAALICWPQPVGLAVIVAAGWMRFPEPTPTQIAVGVFLSYMALILALTWAVIPIIMLLVGPEATLKHIKEDVLPSFSLSVPDHYASAWRRFAGFVRSWSGRAKHGQQPASPQGRHDQRQRP